LVVDFPFLEEAGLTSIGENRFWVRAVRMTREVRGGSQQWEEEEGERDGEGGKEGEGGVGWVSSSSSSSSVHGMRSERARWEPRRL